MTEQRGRRVSDFVQLPKLGEVFHDYRVEFLAEKPLEVFQIARSVEAARNAASLYREAYWHGQSALQGMLQWSTVAATRTPSKPKLTDKYDSFKDSKDGQAFLVRVAILSVNGRRIMEFYSIGQVAHV